MLKNIDLRIQKMTMSLEEEFHFLVLCFR